MRVLIVDDEPNICEGLAILSSRALGSGHVIAAESDPVRALERLAEESYDLLITDISMPEIDGLELTRRAKRRSLISHVVIVTGYEEFTYAREALRQGAVDFLLKPVDKEELAAALRSVSDALERNTDADPQSAPVTRALLPGQPAVAADAQTYSTRTGSPRVAVLVTTLAGGTRLRSLARVATREALGAHHRDSAVTVVPAERVDAVVALVPRPADTADEPARVRAWADVVNEYPLGVALGDLRRDALETLADRAYTALVGATLSGTPIVVWNADAGVVAKEGATDVPLDERDLFSPRTIADAIGHLLDGDWGTPLARADACRHLVRLLAVRVAVGTGVPTTELAHEADLAFVAARSRGDVDQLVHELVDRVRSNADRAGSAADRILATIRTTAPTDLYLQGVADRLDLTPGYVSAVLKERTGKSFAAYATELRMELAQQLLAEMNHLTVQQIAESVGFTSPRQFYRQFKRYAGLTPSEYRAGITGEDRHVE